MSRPNPLPDDNWDRMGTPNHVGRALGVLTTWGFALLLVVAFFGLLLLAERDAADADQMARINAELDAADARLQRAAAQLCQAEAGPGAQVLWTQDGDLVCRPAVLAAKATVEVTP